MPLIVAGTESMTLPVGTTAQRPSTSTTGMYRFNSTLGNNEVYNGTFWETDGIVQGTAVATTSGTSVDFTGIPTGVKRITVMFAGVSTSGTSPIGIQLGTGSTTYTTTGYSGSASGGGTGVGSTASSNTMNVQYASAAASTVSGAVYLINVSGNTWVEFGSLGASGTATFNTSGNSITLAAALTAVRVTTVNGTDTFDAGSVNILYEF